MGNSTSFREAWAMGGPRTPVAALYQCLICLGPYFLQVGVDADENPEDLSFEVATGRPDTTRGLWHRLDYKYIKPMLTHCGPPLTDSLPQWCGLFARLFSSPHVQDDEEQLCATELDDSTFNLEKTEKQLGSMGGDSGSAHQEDLLEGDLGLGTAPALAREA